MTNSLTEQAYRDLAYSRYRRARNFAIVAEEALAELMELVTREYYMNASETSVYSNFRDMSQRVASNRGHMERMMRDNYGWSADAPEDEPVETDADVVALAGDPEPSYPTDQELHIEEPDEVSAESYSEDYTNAAFQALCPTCAWSAHGTTTDYILSQVQTHAGQNPGHYPYVADSYVLT